MGHRKYSAPRRGPSLISPAGGQVTGPHEFAIGQNTKVRHASWDLQASRREQLMSPWSIIDRAPELRQGSEFPSDGCRDSSAEGNRLALLRNAERWITNLRRSMVQRPNEGSPQENEDARKI